jgi:hypothetical protein
MQMRRSRASRPSPAIIIAVLALVAAVAGTAVAADPVATTSAKKVTKKKVKKIANKQIDQRAPGLSVAQAETASNANTANSVSPNGVDTTALQDNAVTNAKLGDGAVSSAEIENGQVRATDLGPTVVRSNSVAGTDSPRPLSVNCQAGEQVISGGGGIPNPGSGHVLARSQPLANGWTVTAHGTGNWTLQVYALCLQV